MSVAARPTEQAPTALSDMASLTGLRGVAAFAVMIAHAGYTRSVPSFAPFENNFRWHAPAVDLFFMLSGFVLCMRYAPPRGYTFGKYLTARVARIFPLQWFVMVLMVGLEALGAVRRGSWDPNLTFHDWVLQMLLLQRWPVVGYDRESWNPSAWSLSVEWLVYLTAAPVLIGLVRSRKLASVPLWVLPVAVVVLLAFHSVVMSEAIPAGIIGTGVVRGICGFAEGALIYQMAVRDGRRGGVSWLWTLPFFALLALQGHLGVGNHFLIPVAAVLLWVAVKSDGRGGLLESKPVLSCGLARCRTPFISFTTPCCWCFTGLVSGPGWRGRIR